MSTFKRDVADSILQNVGGLTEFALGDWCPSGARAGWGPDMDGHIPCAKVSDAGVHLWFDIYSEHVKALETALLAAGIPVETTGYKG